MAQSSSSNEAALALDRIRGIINQGGSDPVASLNEITNAIVYYQHSRVSKWLQSDGMVVRGGPFAGLRYLSTSSGSLLIPKFVGSYETELHGTVAKIISSGYEQIVDVGCAEGYYAVGLASRMPDVRVVAFDTDPRARHLCQQLAEINNVAGRVTIEGLCTHQRLQELAGRGSLVICDIEGAEGEFLDPVQAPSLSECDLLVECHDFLGVAYSEILAARFGPTHKVEVIENTWVNPNSIPFLCGLKPIQKFLAVWEGRPGLSPWLFMTVREK